MASITYSISFSSGTSQDLKNGGKLSTNMTQNGEVPSGAKITSATITFSSIAVYSSYGPYLQFGDWFRTASLPQQSTQKSLTVKATSVATAILDISSESFTTTVVSSASTNMLNIKGGATQTIEYEQTYEASTGTLSATSIEAGKSLSVTISNSMLSALSHKLKIALNSSTYVEATSATGASTISATIPTSWLNSITTATTATASATLTTYSGSTLIGSKAYSFSVTVPTSAVPTIGSLTATRVNNSVPSAWGVYVQDKSGVTLTAASVSTSYGSAIRRYTFTMTANGKTTTLATQSAATYTVSEIAGSGTITFKVTATDARGRTSAAKTVSITVQPYSAPSFSAATAGRCNSSGTSSEEGTYINVRGVVTYSSVSSKNTMSLACYYRKNGDTTWTNGKTGMVSGTSYVIGGGAVDTAYSYQVRFVVTDAFSSVEKIVSVSTTSYSIFIREGGTGVGIGKVCEHDNAFEINPDWSFLYGDKDIAAQLNRTNIVYTSDNSTPTGSAGMIWLKKKV